MNMILCKIQIQAVISSQKCKKTNKSLNKINNLMTKNLRLLKSSLNQDHLRKTKMNLSLKTKKISF